MKKGGTGTGSTSASSARPRTRPASKRTRTASLKAIRGANVVATLYVQKLAWAALGKPEHISGEIPRRPDPVWSRDPLAPSEDQGRHRGRPQRDAARPVELAQPPCHLDPQHRCVRRRGTHRQAGPADGAPAPGIRARRRPNPNEDRTLVDRTNGTTEQRYPGQGRVQLLRATYVRTRGEQKIPCGRLRSALP